MTDSQKHEELFAVLKSYASRAKKVIGHCKNEDQTKQLLIVPYIRDILGWNPEDPNSVQLEYQTGIGKGVEKVDYAILEERKAVLLIEAKARHIELSEKPTPQLRRYAIDSQETICVALTNGSVWHWYMKFNGRLDNTPFIKTNGLEPKEQDLPWLAAVRKGPFSKRAIDAAEDQKMVAAVSAWLERAANQPADSLLRLLLKETGWAANKSNIARAKGIWAQAWPREAATEFRVQRAQPEPVQKERGEEEKAQSSRVCRFRTAGSTRWREVDDATYLLQEIVAFCADHHAHGRTAYLRLLSRTEWGRLRRNLLVFSNLPNLWQSVDQRKYSKDFGGYHLFNHISNKGKMAIIERYLACCVRKDGTSPKRGLDIEVEMPNVT